jgi:hypothetical protein
MHGPMNVKFKDLIFKLVTASAVFQCVINLFSQTNALAQIWCPEDMQPSHAMHLYLSYSLILNCNLIDRLILGYLDMHSHTDSQLIVCPPNCCTQAYQFV